MFKMSASSQWSNQLQWVRGLARHLGGPAQAKPQLVSLTAEAGHPTAEISLLDANFLVVAEGVGTLHASVRPGLYVVQYKAGRTVKDVQVSVPPGTAEYFVPIPSLSTRTTAVPTSSTDIGKRLNATAAELSRTVHRHISDGCQLFIFVRRLAESTYQGSSEGLFDLSIRSLAGEVLLDFRETGATDSDGISRGCNIAIAPGAYILRVNAGPVGNLEQAIHVAEGWQTQLLLNSVQYGSEGFIGADLRRGAVLMSRVGAGFNPFDEAIGWVEAAKVSLAGGTAAAPMEELRRAVKEAAELRSASPHVDDLLHHKFTNPMLGILGGHLLLLQHAPDIELLREVISNLEILVPGHPDVQALRYAASLPTDGAPILAPPMLRSSWRAIIDRTVTDPDLLPAGSYADRIATRTWGGGAWLLWKAPPAPRPQAARYVLSGREARSTTAEALQRLFAVLSKILPRQNTEQYLLTLAERLGLEAAEKKLLRYVAGIVRQSQCSEDVATSPLVAGLSERLYTTTYGLLTGRRLPSSQQMLAWLGEQRQTGFQEEAVVNALGMPRSVLSNAVNHLSTLLEGDLVMANPRVCFDRILPKDLDKVRPDAPIPGAQTKAAFEWAKLWDVGQTLRVRFMSGTPDQQAIVKKFVPQWSEHANLKFVFSNDLNAEIRIAFVPSDGAWSYIGTDCKDIPTSQPTMNLSWQDEGVVLHEFGHAIGLIHEHQNPLGGIKWNKPAVYADLKGPPNYWDEPTIDNNMFRTYSKDQINGTSVDKASVMLYEIPKSWTTDDWSSKANEILSQTDKDFAHDQRNYPFKGARKPHGG